MTVPLISIRLYNIYKINKHKESNSAHFFTLLKLSLQTKIEREKKIFITILWLKNCPIFLEKMNNIGKVKEEDVEEIGRAGRGGRLEEEKG